MPLLLWTSFLEPHLLPPIDFIKLYFHLFISRYFLIYSLMSLLTPLLLFLVCSLFFLEFVLPSFFSLWFYFHTIVVRKDAWNNSYSLKFVEAYFVVYLVAYPREYSMSTGKGKKWFIYGCAGSLLLLAGPVLHCGAGSSLRWLLFLQNTGSRAHGLELFWCMGSVVAAQA